MTIASVGQLLIIFFLAFTLYTLYTRVQILKYEKSILEAQINDQKVKIKSLESALQREQKVLQLAKKQGFAPSETEIAEKSDQL